MELGFAIDRARVPDEGWQIEQALVEGAAGHALNCGTGLTPRDVTPQATAAIVDYEVPGLAEVYPGAEGCLVDADARARAALSRPVGLAVVNVPGSPRGALESDRVSRGRCSATLSRTSAGPLAATAAGDRPDLPAGGGRG